jgi:hypothetical protein
MGDDALRDRITALALQCCDNMRVSPDPVSAAQIRLWLEAFGLDASAYLDAPQTGRQIAPRAMLGAFTGRRLPDWRSPDSASSDLTREIAGLGLASIGTGIAQEYHRDIEVDDKIEERTQLESVSPRKMTKAGAGYFITIRSEFHAGQGKLVGVQRIRLLAFGAEDTGEDAGAGKSRQSASAPPAEPIRRQALTAHAISLDRMGIIACTLACGDFNAAHCDPEIARSHGLEDSFADVYTAVGLAYAFARSTDPHAPVANIDLTLGSPFYAGDTITLSGDRLDFDAAGSRIALSGQCRTGVHIRGTVGIA